MYVYLHVQYIVRIHVGHLGPSWVGLGLLNNCRVSGLIPVSSSPHVEMSLIKTLNT